MWRHHNMCWKWPQFAFRQDWTRRAEFWKVLASTSAVTAWMSPVMFSFKASVVRSLCAKLALSDIPITNNQAAPLAKWQRPAEWRVGQETGRLAGGPLLRVATIRFTTDTFLFISHTTNVLLLKFRYNIFIVVRIIKEMSGSVASVYLAHSTHWLYLLRKSIGLKMV